MNLFSVAFSLFVTVLFILYYTVFRKKQFIQHGILCLFRHCESDFYGNHRIQCVCGWHMVDAFF